MLDGGDNVTHQLYAFQFFIFHGNIEFIFKIMDDPQELVDYVKKFVIL